MLIIFLQFIELIYRLKGQPNIIHQCLPKREYPQKYLNILNKYFKSIEMIPRQTLIKLQTDNSNIQLLCLIYLIPIKDPRAIDVPIYCTILNDI